jgi:hypothetical protein
MFKNEVTTVSPGVFAVSMQLHWENKLGNKSSSRLMELWMTLAGAYNSVLEGIHAEGWSVLQLPTGTGKTQGTALYCSMLYESNRHRPVGVLIVSRTIEQCDELVSIINRHSGGVIAYSHNAKKPLTTDSMSEAPILVITHAALVQGLGGLVKDTNSKWDSYSWWYHGKRRLMIIDESLSGIVEESRLKLTKLRMVLGIIPSPVRSEYSNEVKALEYLLRHLEVREKQVAEGGTPGKEVLWACKASNPDLPVSYDLSKLKRELSKHDFDKELFNRENHTSDKPIKVIIDDVLRCSHAILQGWCLYAKLGNEHTLITALRLIPDDAPPAVILDATARQSVAWELMGANASVIPAPVGVRSYEHVKLHVARARGLGKTGMLEKGKARFPRFYKALNKEMTSDRKLLVCTHKCVEHHASDIQPDAHTSIAHWGAIDGKNDWQDHDAIAILGLQYMDDVWPISMFLAFQGVQTNEWLKSPSWGDYDNVCSHLQRRQMSASVIQAINRVQCRKVSDEFGNCLPTDVFIVLPVGTDGDAILQVIHEEMPGIQQVPWSFQTDDPQDRVRKGSTHETLLYLMSTRRGTISMDWIAGELRLTTNGKRELMKTLRDQSHHLTLALADLGFRLVVQGKGRGAKSYLVHGLT